MDSIFANYLSRPGVRQPIFTSYCDGRNVTCNGLSQWGSKYLGDEGYSPIQIIRYYYGSDMYINTAVSVSGVPSSWPGYNLGIGASGDKVLQIQHRPELPRHPESHRRRRLRSPHRRGSPGLPERLQSASKRDRGLPDMV